MKKIVILFSFIILTNCYESGNIGSIIILSSNIKSKTLIDVTDSTHNEGILALPKKYNHLLQFNDYDHLIYRIFYFDKEPQEIYMVTFQGSESIRYIYSFEKERWLNSENNFSEIERRRIHDRLVYEVLEKIRNKAIELNYNDEEIYVDLKTCGSKLLCKNVN
ncbi:hypothetical protein [Nonlabens sp. Asnod3-A02]|uniref:hypothetical protein n=1 Tax=Nonlabens sp. Asnod3-A02 TaxID=3160579 RepID=UPI00386FBE95